MERKKELESQLSFIETDEEIKQQTNCSYFIPTEISFADLLESGRLDSAVALYDIARFVEEIVLSEKVYAEINTFRIIFNHFHRLGLSTSEFLRPVESRLKSVPSSWEFGRMAHVFKHVFENIDQSPTDLRVLRSLGNEKEISSQIHNAARIFQKVTSSINLNTAPGLGFVPYLSPAVQPGRQHYSTIARELGVTRQNIESILGTQEIDVPPLFSILVGRMSSSESFAEELVKLRHEFSELREEASKFEAEIRGVDSIREKCELVEAYKADQHSLVKMISNKPAKTKLRRAWDVTKGASVSAIISYLGDYWLDINDRRKALTNVQRYVDLHEMVVTTGALEKQLNKLFSGSPSKVYTSARTISAKLESFLRPPSDG